VHLLIVEEVQMDDLLTNPAVIEAQAGKPGQLFCRKIAEFPAQIDASLVMLSSLLLLSSNHEAHSSSNKDSLYPFASGVNRDPEPTTNLNPTSRSKIISNHPLFWLILGSIIDIMSINARKLSHRFFQLVLAPSYSCSCHVQCANI